MTPPQAELERQRNGYQKKWVLQLLRYLRMLFRESGTILIRGTYKIQHIWYLVRDGVAAGC